jgi:pyruvate, water dikinase
LIGLLIFGVYKEWNSHMLAKNLFKYWTYQIFSPGTILREKYDAFKSLLVHDQQAHQLMAELEEIYHSGSRVDLNQISSRYAAFSKAVGNIITELARMSPTKYLDLKEYYKKFDFYARFLLAPPEFEFSPPFCLSLDEIPDQGLERAGGKALNLALVRKKLGLPVPDGFVITTNAYQYFLEFNDLRPYIRQRLAEIDLTSDESLESASKDLIDRVMAAEIPIQISEAIENGCISLSTGGKDRIRMAVRSSAVGEDGEASFAGQYRSILNVSPEKITNAYKKVVASKFAPAALYYRIHYGLSDDETPMAVLVLPMIDALSSGVVYTQDPEDTGVMRSSVHAVWGYGELLVSGEVAADVFTVLKTKPAAIISKKIETKTRQLVFSPEQGTVEVPVEAGNADKPVLGQEQVLKLAQWGETLEKFFQSPQDVEWSLDHDRRLFILQSRPLRLDEAPSLGDQCQIDTINAPVLLQGGECAAMGVGSGPVFTVTRDSDLAGVPEKAVLVVDRASPSYVKILDRVSAVVADTGSTAGHFSSVAREFGVPTLVNTRDATTRLARGDIVTVHAEGRTVYGGIVAELLENPCVRKEPLTDSPYMRKLSAMMAFVSPLELLDPAADNFKPEGCRSLHDILRFAHEKAVHEMFSIGNRRFTRKMGARKLVTEIPMQVYVLDVGGGVGKEAEGKTVPWGAVECIPMRALWKGLNHPDIQWADFSHFDWASYDKMVMSGGIISPESSLLSSYAVLARNYVNLALKFGYHFVVVDAVCGDRAQENYIMFRFAGGGADYEGRYLRVAFLNNVLDRLGFNVTLTGDLIDARIDSLAQPAMERKLDMLGRLLGATRLMDMYLKDASQVQSWVEDFMKGRYRFVDLEAAGED